MEAARLWWPPSSSSGSLRREAETSTQAKRIIYFIGHKDQTNSALITQVCRDYETVSQLHRGESATRTLLNLYNLHAVRGLLSADNRLVFESSMSGPHHYFGWVDPTKHHTIEMTQDGPIYMRVNEDEAQMRMENNDNSKKVPVDDDFVLRVTGYEWMHGATVSAETRRSYAVKDEIAVHLVDTDSGVADSLFDDPGILVLEEDQLPFPLISDPQNYDLSPFHAQVVPNDRPFAFDQELVAKYKHAQHKLRVVTYNYADRYREDYLMHGSGVFIERHEFIQAITPMNPQCGGFVMLGREVNAAETGDDVVGEEKAPTLELVAVTIPFGYTLLVDVGSIHGDSTLTGLYMMAMTGNHHAMRTADTVFLKNRATHKNVVVTTVPPMEPVAGLAGDHFLLTSDEKSLAALAEEDQELKSRITDSVGKITALWWRPVISTGTASIGWDKTLGFSLPKNEV